MSARTARRARNKCNSGQPSALQPSREQLHRENERLLRENEELRRKVAEREEHCLNARSRSRMPKANRDLGGNWQGEEELDQLLQTTFFDGWPASRDRAAEAQTNENPAPSGHPDIIGDWFLWLR
jgi:hypothetical protein